MEPLKKSDVDLLNKNTIFLLVFVMFSFASCTDSVDNEKIGTEMIEIPATLGEEGAKSDAEITFEKTEEETGKIAQGDILYFTFPFTNTGTGPLIISSVTGSCGCTIPKSYPRGKILPGEGGEIEVEFNSDNKWGEQTISIAVSANTTPSLNQLIIRTDIVVPDNMKNNK